MMTTLLVLVLFVGGVTIGVALVVAVASGAACAAALASHHDPHHRRLQSMARSLESAGLARTRAARWEGPVSPAALDAAAETPACRMALPVGSGTLRVWPRPGRRQRATGDPEFDRRCRVTGAPGDRARLTHAVRTRWRALATRGRLTLRDGVLALQVADRAAPGLSDVVEQMLQLALHLEGLPATPAERVADMARHDPVTAVRLRALGWLEQVEPAEAARIAGRGLADPDLEIRLASARHLGFVEPLLDAVGNPTVSPRLRAQAARWLLGVAPDREVVGVARFLAVSAQPELEEAAVALALHTSDESSLVRLLRARSPTALRAALVALRELGTPAAIPMLRNVEANSAALTGRRRLAATALTAIRTRLSGHAGGLALAVLGEQIGAVSPVHVAGGVSEVA